MKVLEFLTKYIYLIFGILLAGLGITVMVLSSVVTTRNAEIARLKRDIEVQAIVYNETIARMQKAYKMLEIKKEQVITKYVPVSSDKLDTCEKQINEILKVQESFYERN